MQVVHKPALVDGEYLVKSTSNMESDCRYVFKTLTLIVGQRFDLLFCEIPLVGTTVVEFVSILLCLHAS